MNTLFGTSGMSQTTKSDAFERTFNKRHWISESPDKQMACPVSQLTRSWRPPNAVQNGYCGYHSFTVL